MPGHSPKARYRVTGERNTPIQAARGYPSLKIENLRRQISELRSSPARGPMSTCRYSHFLDVFATGLLSQRAERWFDREVDIALSVPTVDPRAHLLRIGKGARRDTLKPFPSGSPDIQPLV